MAEQLKSLLEFAEETARQAGQITLEYYQQAIQPEYKGDDSPVTIGDRKAEQYIRERIEQTYPEHGIVGEEYGEKETPGTTHRWIIDPIDGTKAFVRGVSLYSVLLALEIEGEVEVGVAYFPALNEMVAAATGLGCRWNGKKAQVSGISDLSQAFLVHSDVYNFTRYQRDRAWEKIQENVYACAGWGDAYGHALVATGRAEIMLDPIMHIWDCGPFIPILKEAGGYFGDWQGKETIAAGEALSTNGALLDQVLEILNK
jgi:myo-inositol-1(or 4)-monophosphatase